MASKILEYFIYKLVLPSSVVVALAVKRFKLLFFFQYEKIFRLSVFFLYF